MYGWRERSPVRYPTPKRPKRSRSHSLQRVTKTSGSPGKSPFAPMVEYRCDNSGGKQTKSLTLRAFTDGLPSPGDLRNFLTSKRQPPKEKWPGVTEHVVQDYCYPQTCHEIQMIRHEHPGNGSGSKGDSVGQSEVKPMLSDGSQTTVNTLGGYTLPFDTLRHKTAVVRRKNVVDGDQDDKQKYKEYVKRHPTTSNDFNACRCRGKGVQVWMRLCGCGCRCSRCRAVVRYKEPQDEDGDSDATEDDDDPLGWN